MKYLTTIALVASLIVSAAAASRVPLQFNIAEVDLSSLQKRSVNSEPMEVSPHVLKLSRVAGHVTNLTDSNGYEYIASIIFGSETLQVIVDSGSSDTWAVQKDFICLDHDGIVLNDMLFYQPIKFEVKVDISDALAAAIPGSFYNVSSGAYCAPCNATVPDFGIVINGHTFYADKADLFQTSDPIDSGDGTLTCYLGVTDGGEGPYILGDTMMNSLVTVFDVGAGLTIDIAYNFQIEGFPIHYCRLILIYMLLKRAAAATTGDQYLG
ncbi:hypothetical protein LX36DRAFT_675664 [Colletotrichum falcatum]|nr:hypothetical protein LX36DRAFT_675664 [Colletotrichum falcatum]